MGGRRPRAALTLQAGEREEPRAAAERETRVTAAASPCLAVCFLVQLEDSFLKQSEKQTEQQSADCMVRTLAQKKLGKGV